MTCGHCVQAVTAAIEAKDPTAKVVVDVADGTVKAETILPRHVVSMAVEEEGYAGEGREPPAVAAPDRVATAAPQLLPPSTTKCCAVTIALSSAASHSTMRAMSSGSTRALEALVGLAARLGLRRQPQRLLAFGIDPAGHHLVHPDAVGAEVARQAARQAAHRRLRRGIGRHAAGAVHPGYRTEVDDRPAAGAAHHRHHRLGAEELVAQVGRHAFVPVVGLDRLQRVAVVARGVVHQHGDVADPRAACATAARRAAMSRRSQAMKAAPVCAPPPPRRPSRRNRGRRRARPAARSAPPSARRCPMRRR